MKATVVTTITSSIDIDTFETSHEVDVHTTDPLPQNVVIAASVGGCRSALAALKQSRTQPRRKLERTQPKTEDEP